MRGRFSSKAVKCEKCGLFFVDHVPVTHECKGYYILLPKIGDKVIVLWSDDTETEITWTGSEFLGETVPLKWKPLKESKENDL